MDTNNGAAAMTTTTQPANIRRQRYVLKNGNIYRPDLTFGNPFDGDRVHVVQVRDGKDYGPVRWIRLSSVVESFLVSK